MLKFNGSTYGVMSGGTLAQGNTEIGSDYRGYVDGIYKQSGVVFSCMAVRMRVFSEARFQFRQLRSGRPGDYFGTSELAILENPWPNGTTGDLLTRMVQHADLAGNAYVVRLSADRMTCLRPDWVSIIAGSPRKDAQLGDPDIEAVGYTYTPGGPGSGRDPWVFRAEQVAHFAPIPDPSASFRGMSWLTPVITEICGDQAAMVHKERFFSNGATVNLVVTVDPNWQWTPSTAGWRDSTSAIRAPRTRTRRCSSAAAPTRRSSAPT
jgi:hypothetical protein